MDASDTALENLTSILFHCNVTQVIYLSFLSDIIAYTFVMLCFQNDDLSYDARSEGAPLFRQKKVWIFRAVVFFKEGVPI